MTTRFDDRQPGDLSLAAALRETLAFRLFLASIASLVVVSFGRALPGGDEVRWVMLAAVVVLAVRGMGYGRSLLIAGVAWLYGVGFVSHELGMLTPLGRAEITSGAALAVLALSAAQLSGDRRRANSGLPAS